MNNKKVIIAGGGIVSERGAGAADGPGEDSGAGAGAGDGVAVGGVDGVAGAGIGGWAQLERTKRAITTKIRCLSLMFTLHTPP